MGKGRANKRCMDNEAYGWGPTPPITDRETLGRIARQNSAEDRDVLNLAAGRVKDEGDLLWMALVVVLKVAVLTSAMLYGAWYVLESNYRKGGCCAW
jgi:hypothetical protein